MTSTITHDPPDPEVVSELEEMDCIRIVGAVQDPIPDLESIADAAGLGISPSDGDDEVLFVLTTPAGRAELEGLVERSPGTPVIQLLERGDPAAASVFESGARDIWFMPLAPEIMAGRMKALAACVRAQRTLARENRRLEEMNERMKRYVGNVAHDLRGPLGKLINTSEILLSGVEADSVNTFYHILARTSRRGFDLVNNILDLTALESGHLRIEKASCNMSEIADQVVTELNYQAVEKEISLRNRILMPLIVEADGMRMLQVVSNLVNNAIKFTPRFGTVTLQAKPVEGGMRVEVTDTGIGMTGEQVARLFTLGPEKTSTRGTDGERGTGLGLAISREIVKAHGSELEVRSTLDEGSTFSFILPMWDA